MSVSAIITTRNRDMVLERAIESVRFQTYPVDELVIADNASSDRTPDIIRAVSVEDYRVVAIRHDELLPITYNWISAVEAARGEWIKFCFDDDYLEAECVERLHGICDDDTVIAQCGARFDWLDRVAYDQPRGPLARDVRDGRLSVSPVTALIRRDALLDTFARMPGLLSERAILSGVGPCVLMNYLQVVGEPNRHRHIPDVLVQLGGDELPGEARSLTSRLRDSDPGLLVDCYEEAYAVLDRFAA